MTMNNVLTITVSGPQRSGKTVMVARIAKALRDAGIDCSTEIRYDATTVSSAFSKDHPKFIDQVIEDIDKLDPFPRDREVRIVDDHNDPSVFNDDE